MVSYLCFSRYKFGMYEVLILVVVDNGLVPLMVILLSVVVVSLNPCCSGQWSRTADKETGEFVEGVS